VFSVIFQLIASPNKANAFTNSVRQFVEMHGFKQLLPVSQYDRIKRVKCWDTSRNDAFAVPGNVYVFIQGRVRRRLVKREAFMGIYR